MAGFFGYVGSVAGLPSLNVRAVTRALLRTGARARTFEDRDVNGQHAAVLVECEDEGVRVDEQPGVMLAPVLLFDGARRDLMTARLAGIRDIDSFVTRELDVGPIGGGFAFAIWGRAHRTLALGCDGTGLRPIYFYATERWLVFSSEVGALLASDLVRRDVSPSALLAYLRDGGLADGCLVDGVQRLRPGSYMVVRPFSSSTGRLGCRDMPTDEEGMHAALRDTVAAQISRGDPTILVARGGSRPRDAVLDAVRQAGSGSIVRLSFSPGEHAAVPGVVDHVIDVAGCEPASVLDGVLSSWDQPVADGIFAWLSVVEAKRLGARLLLCDLALEPRPAPRLPFVERALRRSPALGRRPLFHDREIATLVKPASVFRLESREEAQPEMPGHLLDLTSLTQMAAAHSLGLCVPPAAEAAEPAQGMAIATPVPAARTFRSWILEHYAEQGLDALQALAESGIFDSEALQNRWHRFRFDVDPSTTSGVWGLISLGAWVRRHSIIALAV